MRLIQIKKNKKKTHTQWYGFSHCPKRLFCGRYLSLQDFNLALFQCDDDAFKEKVFSLNKVEQLKHLPSAESSTTKKFITKYQTLRQMLLSLRHTKSN